MSQHHIVYPDAAERQAALDEKIVENNTMFDDLFEAAQKEYAA